MHQLRFFTLCPFHTDSFGMGALRAPEAYLQDVREQVLWADAHGLYGTVIYNFASSLDPLATAQLVLSLTRRLRPMIAVQPAQLHPFALVRALATLAYLYHRGVDLNVVAGASPEERRRLGDALDEEEKHERLREYVGACQALCAGAATCTGRFFTLHEASVQPPLPPVCRPQFYIPGSSPASCHTVQTYAHCSLLMAKPLDLLREELVRVQGARTNLRHGLIVGLVARATDEQAWAALETLAHQDRRTRLTNRLFVAKTSSQQHRVNLELADRQSVFDERLWYGSAKIGIDAPKLVGSYQQVREALGRYIALGVTDILLDLPDHLSEYEHILQVIGPLLA